MQWLTQPGAYEATLAVDEVVMLTCDPHRPDEVQKFQAIADRLFDIHDKLQLEVQLKAMVSVR